MGTMTKYGVSYDLSEDTLIYAYKGWVFWFSSKRHLDRFREELDKRIERADGSFTRRYHVDVDAGDWAVFQLYMQVETRGFKVSRHGMEYRSPSQICFTASVKVV